MLEFISTFAVIMIPGLLCRWRWPAHGWDWYIFSVLTLLFVLGGSWIGFFAALFIGWRTAREYPAR